MQNNWFDKLLGRFGFSRIRNSAESGTLSAASMWEWIMSPFGGFASIDTELRYRLPLLRREARKLAFNNPIISQYLELLRNNVIGHNGFRIQSQIKNNDGKLNKVFNDKVEAAWRDFWSNPFVDCRNSGIGGEQLLMQAMAVDGEIFIRLVIGSQFKHGLALQMIDPDQIDCNLNQPRSAGQNEIRLGVEVDQWSKPVAYHCHSSNPNDMNGNRNDVIRIPAEEMIHLFDPERIGQTRGFTWFNSVMQNLRNLDGYVEAAIIAARTAACAVPIFKQTADFGVDEKAANYKVNIQPGSGITLPAGLELQNWDPKHPNTNHAEFLKGNHRYTSCGLNVSYNALCNDLEGVNYSSMRSGLLIERDGWRSLQRLWIDRFLTPIFNRFIWAALLSGTLVLDSRDARKFQAVKWIPRGWSWVDPLKDMNAAVLAIENQLGSRTRYLAEQGDDFEDICADLASEQNIAESSGLIMHQVEAAPAPETTAPTEKNRKRAALRLAVMNLIDDDEEFDASRLTGLLKGHTNG